mmetsp:Transcript_131657/g.421198  ORF Transcript_131657/g.421198 Transcript_131657/m.421198 type:complete len:200 (-) Transcript_131657:5-604(-)
MARSRCASSAALAWATSSRKEASLSFASLTSASAITTRSFCSFSCACNAESSFSSLPLSSTSLSRCLRRCFKLAAVSPTGSSPIPSPIPSSPPGGVPIAARETELPPEEAKTKLALGVPEACSLNDGAHAEAAMPHTTPTLTPPARLSVEVRLVGEPTGAEPGVELRKLLLLRACPTPPCMPPSAHADLSPFRGHTPRF